MSYEFISRQTPEFFPKTPYKSIRIGLHDFMLNLTPFLHLNGSLMLSLNFLVIYFIF